MNLHHHRSELIPAGGPITQKISIVTSPFERCQVGFWIASAIELARKKGFDPLSAGKSLAKLYIADINHSLKNIFNFKLDGQQTIGK